MDDEGGSTAAALAESSATQRKWASFVLLGPLMPSLLAVLIIVVGGAIVKVMPFMWNLTEQHTRNARLIQRGKTRPDVLVKITDEPVPR